MNKHPQCKECGANDGIYADASVGWNRQSASWEQTGHIEGVACSDCGSENILWIEEEETND